jgi:hypothetical protein
MQKTIQVYNTIQTLQHVHKPTQFYNTLQHFTQLYKTFFKTQLYKQVCKNLHNSTQLYTVLQISTQLYKPIDKSTKQIQTTFQSFHKHSANTCYKTSQKYTSLHKSSKLNKTSQNLTILYTILYKLYTTLHNLSRFNKTLHNSTKLCKHVTNKQALHYFTQLYQTNYTTLCKQKAICILQKKTLQHSTKFTQPYQTLHNFNTTLQSFTQLYNNRNSTELDKTLHKSTQLCQQQKATQQKTLHSFEKKRKLYTPFQNHTQLYETFCKTIQHSARL